MLDNTVVDTKEVEAAKIRFYDIRDKIEWLEENNGDYDAPLPEKGRGAFFVAAQKSSPAHLQDCFDSICLSDSVIFNDVIHILVASAGKTN